MSDLQFPYWPQEQQKQAWKMMLPVSETTVNAYIGTKYSGKSWLLRALNCTMLIDKPLTGIIYAREYFSLKDLHIEPIKSEMSDFIDAGLVRWIQNDKQFVFEETGSILRVQQISRPSDIHSENGKRYDIVCIEEAQNFTPFELKFFSGLAGPSPHAIASREKVKIKMRAADNAADRDRYKKLLQRYFYIPKTLYSANWGGVGHNYLVSHFYEGCSHPRQPEVDTDEFETETTMKIGDDGEEYEHTEMIEDPDDFNFTFGTWRDNKIGMEENPEYIASLKRYPEPYRTAYVEGDPYAFGGLKYAIVNPVHEVDMDDVLEEFDGVIPDHWLLLGALDPGTASPCSFSLYVKKPNGQIIQISDYYESGKGFDDHAEDIYEHIVGGPHARWTGGRKPQYIIAGHDSWHKKSRYSIRSHDVTLNDIFWNEYGLRLAKCNTDRILGAMSVANALDYKMDEKTGVLERPPSLQFATYKSKTPNGPSTIVHLCEPTTDELESLVDATNNPEDIKRGPHIPDHAFDKTKYFILGAPSPAELSTTEERKPELSDYGRFKDDEMWKPKSERASKIDDAMVAGSLDM